MTDYYSQQYWIDAIKDIEPSTYKSQIFFDNIGKVWSLPAGLRVQLGVVIGHTFDAMKQYWGEDQVLGIDLHNYRNDPNVWCVDVNQLKVKLPCAYIENDIGSSFNPDGKRDRWAATQWGVQCLVSGGIMITNVGELINAPVEQFAVDNGCEVIPMSKFDNQPWAQWLNNETPYKTQGWCILQKSLEEKK